MTSRISPFYKVKCVVLGNSAIGKSSLVKLVYSNRHDPYKVESTIGAAFVTVTIEMKDYPVAKQTVNIPGSSGTHQMVKADVWDLAGSPRYHSMLSMYARDVDICFIVFDLNNRESWLDLTKWREKILQHNTNTQEHFPLFILIGNKNDLIHNVTEAEIRQRCLEWNCKYYSLSAIRDDSASIFRQTLHDTIKDFHELILSLERNGTPHEKTLIANSYNNEKPLQLNITPSRSSCCY